MDAALDGRPGICGSETLDRSLEVSEAVTGGKTQGWRIRCNAPSLEGSPFLLGWLHDTVKTLTRPHHPDVEVSEDSHAFRAAPE